MDSALDASLDDEIDGGQSEEDQVEDAFGSWTESKTANRGSLYTQLSEPRVMESVQRRYDYLDSNDLLGSYRQKWSELPWMQDGGFYLWLEGVPGCEVPPEVPAWDPSSTCCDLRQDPQYPPPNDGGCPELSDPDDPSYYWTQQKQVFFPEYTDGAVEHRTDDRVADLAQNSAEKMLISTQRQFWDQSAPPPDEPVSPTLTEQNDGLGDLHVEIDLPGVGLGELMVVLYRAEGAGSYVQIARLGESRSYHDGNVLHSHTYRYAARSYAHGGSVSALSEGQAITVVDSTPPLAPAGLGAVTDGLQATLTWDAYRDDDLYGFNGYVSTSPGGPYQKINGSVRPIYQPWEMSLIVSSPGTYFVVMTAVDFAGNESAESEELAVVLGP